jgi:hypothetical protein
MNPIVVPVASLTDIVVDVTGLGLVCIALWCWALPRIASGRRRDVAPSLVALAISAPVAYYLLWLLTTPPAVISGAGVTGGAGPPYYTPTTIRWNNVRSVRCIYTVWRRWGGFGVSVQSGLTALWVGRMSRVHAEELLEAMQAYAPPGTVEGCPAWSDPVWSFRTK